MVAYKRLKSALELEKILLLSIMTISFLKSRAKDTTNLRRRAVVPAAHAAVCCARARSSRDLLLAPLDPPFRSSKVSETAFNRPKAAKPTLKRRGKESETPSSSSPSSSRLASMSTTSFAFDQQALTQLAREIPRELRLIRLRLRFGGPRRLTVGERVQIVVDLIDETGQPPSLSPALLESLELTARCVQDHQHASLYSLGSVAGSSDAQWVKGRLQWTLSTVFQLEKETESRFMENSTPAVRLLVGIKDTPQGGSSAHDALQQFCVGSQWLTTETLVLPVQSDRIELLANGTESATTERSSTCRRLFSVSCENQSSRTIAMQENYGDTMGSHLWDASILLSFGLIHAGARSLVERTKMLELGAGCGLFACVFAAVFSDLEQDAASMLLTERSASLPLLKANLEENIGKSVPYVLTPLVWGQPVDPSDNDAKNVNTSANLVFAADVLYNWPAHRELLSSMSALSSDHARVFLAHKHRSKATSHALEQVLSGQHQQHCTSNNGSKMDCPWKDWQVTRLATLASVDLLQLTRKQAEDANAVSHVDHH